MSSNRLLVNVQEERLRRETVQALQSSEHELSFDQHTSDWASFLERVAQTRPDAVVLDLSAMPEGLTVSIRQLRHHAPRVKVVALHSSADSDTILAAMRAGANEFLYPPLNGNLHAALERILSSETSDVPSLRGKVIGFLSAKGGCGATTIATHIACELQRITQRKVLLGDLDLTSGLVGFLLKASGKYSILDAVKNLSRLDESLWKALVVEQKPDFAIMPAPASYSRWDHPDEGQLRQVVQFMRTQHDWTVLDLGRSLNSIATAILDEIDMLFLVSTFEVVALQGLKSIVHGLFGQGEKLQLILNRTPKMMDVTTQELEKILGRNIYTALPNDYPALYASYSNGNLLDANSRLAQHFTQLASKISGIPLTKSKKKFALFG